jgi:hypothetical protein
MARRGSLRSPWRSYGTSCSYQGSNGYTWPRNPWNRWHSTKRGNDTMLTNWYIHLMVKHGPALIAFIVRKHMRLVMYVLHWQQMGSILMDWWLPHTHVGPCSLSPSISPRCMLSKTEYNLVIDNSWTPGEWYGCVHGACDWWIGQCLGGRRMDIRPSYKDKLQNACLVPLLSA